MMFGQRWLKRLINSLALTSVTWLHHYVTHVMHALASLAHREQEAICWRYRHVKETLCFSMWRQISLVRTSKRKSKKSLINLHFYHCYSTILPQSFLCWWPTDQSEQTSLFRRGRSQKRVSRVLLQWAVLERSFVWFCVFQSRLTYKAKIKSWTWKWAE